MSPQIDLNAENNSEGFFPTVSIVIPVYNGMRTIRNCLDAILAVVIGGGSLMGGRFNLLLSVIGALIIQGMNTGILLSGFQPELNQVVKAVVVLCVLIVQSPRFVSIIKGIRGHDKT